MRTAVARVLVLALLATALMTGCSDTTSSRAQQVEHPNGAEPRPLTTEEAERLALVRFHNFDDGVRPLHFEVTDSGVTYVVNCWVDWTAGVGYGVATDGAGTESLLLAWTDGGVSTHPWTADEPAPIPPPDLSDGAQEWTSSSLTPGSSRLHAVLALALTLGSDRPDNALLLSQTDARWLRTDDVAGVPVDVIAGPTADVAYDPRTSTSAGDASDSTVHYWVGEDGTLLRVEVRLGGAGDWTQLDLGPAAEVEFAAAFLGPGND